MARVEMRLLCPTLELGYGIDFGHFEFVVLCRAVVWLSGPFGPGPQTGKGVRELVMLRPGPGPVPIFRPNSNTRSVGHRGVAYGLWSIIPAMRCDPDHSTEYRMTSDGVRRYL